MNGPVKIWKRLTWQRVKAADMRIKEPGKETVLALSFSVLYVFAAAATGLLIRSCPMPILGAARFTDDLWYALFFKTGLLLVVPAAWFLLRGYKPADLLPGWKISGGTVLWAVLAFAMGASLNMGRLHFIGEAAPGFTTGGLLARAFIGAALALLAAGIPEEFFFRGILQTRLELSFGRAASVLLTSVLFTAWHLPTRFLLSSGVEGEAGDLDSVLLGTGAPVFVVSLVFCLLWDRYRSLVPLIAAHFGIDLIPAVISMLGVTY